MFNSIYSRNYEQEKEDNKNRKIMNGYVDIFYSEFKRISEVDPKIIQHVHKRFKVCKPDFYTRLFIAKTFGIKNKLQTEIENKQ
jgi:hypothetical protein